MSAVIAAFLLQMEWAPVWTALPYAAATALLISLTYYTMFRPLNRIRDLCETGYTDQFKWDRYGRTKRQLANEARRMKKLGDVPPVFPNGWFAICESDEIKPGESKAISSLGENWVVFRTEDGKACVLDAYCPHLGAHLGVGSRVVGNCVECPFHGWQFNGHDGRCTNIPYTSGKVPTTAKVRCWPSDEVNGYIFVWYHAEAELSETPQWHVPSIPEISSKQWTYRGRTDYKVNAHIQEIPENGADVAHLGHLHGPSMLYGSVLSSIAGKNEPSWSDKWTPVLQHHWTVAWTGPEPGKGDQHIGVTTLHHDLRLLGRVPLIIMDVEAQQIGPGLVHLYVNTTFGRCVLVQTVTPIEPFVQRVVHRMYAAPSILSPYANLVLWGEAIMFERDVAVWNHKTYVSRPLLVSEDRTIGRHRRWYQQFYSEHSPRIDDIQRQKNALDW